MVLATPDVGAEPRPSADAQGGGRPACMRTLHCSYVVSGDGASAALAWTDAGGELAHGEVLVCGGECTSDDSGAAELCEDVLEATTRVRMRKAHS